MRRLTRLAALATMALSAPAFAQHADHHAGHGTEPARPAPPPWAAGPHAGHAAPADPHAGHGAQPSGPPPPPWATPSADPHAGHGAHAGHAPAAGPSTPPPPVPRDHAAEAFFPAAEMARARAQLRAEHGGMRWWQATVETLELRPEAGDDGYAWEGEVSFGGGIDRFVLLTEGEGTAGDRPEQVEVQLLWRRAVSPYFNLRAGVRHDFEPRPRRTYASVGIEGVSPYWVELSAAAFLSDKGGLSARLEASTDFRLTQRLVLQPSAEANLAADDDVAVGVGSGLSDVELAMRLRYHLTPDLAPYVGVVHERAFGRTADLVRGHGEAVRETRAVVGLTARF
ncbi:MAG: copper resistance protein B [Phenylobacterium sp.]|uniref:copper resistance protein B n=1 Tax=Phenylobacterium sp. TaxID=1871053 RepID=UPI002A35D9B2|nr:copper resistance protein B [Phenylobacterium sp.]MDX9996892.1 copper resistance protein B [Phenylobacterium sp.]